jgi:microcystin-dependent protein
MTEIIEATSFPNSFKISGLLLRTDLGKFYLNTSGDEDSPLFEELGPAIPSGMIQIFAGNAIDIPIGWIRCSGIAISRTTYAALFAAIGTIYGVGDGSTTFNLPDLETDNKFISTANSDFDLNNDDGINSFAISANQMPVHNHDYVDTVLTSAIGNYNTSGNTANTAYTNLTSNNVTSNKGGNDVVNNRPHNLQMWHAIKI